MNKFNLTFSGEMESDKRPEEVRQRFAELFGIDDSERLERFFSGKPVVMRRHLDRKEAAQWYRDMRSIGAYAELVKVSQEEIEAEEAAAEAAAQQQRQQAAAAAKKQAQEKKRSSKREASAKAAREKAARVQEKRLAAEAAARQKAARERQRKEKLELQREEERKATVEREAEKKRLAAAAKARKKAEATKLAEQKATEQAAAAARAKQREAERKAELEASLEAKRKAALEAQRKAEIDAQTRAEEKRKAAEETAREQILDELQQRRASAEELRQQKALEEQAITRGASELARGVKTSGQQPATRTRVDLPLRRKQQVNQQQPPTPRKRQPGEPNLYQLNAFRVSQLVRERGARAIARRRTGFLLVAFAVLLLAASAFYYSSLAPLENIAGADAVAADANGQLYILAGNKLFQHDRAGLGKQVIEIAELGLESLRPPLQFRDDGALLALGTLAGTGDPGGAAASLLQCNLQALDCQLFSNALQGRNLATFHAHPIDGSIFVLDAAEDRKGELLRLDSAGQILEKTVLTLPAQPAMRLDSGLLLLNSASGPAISVYRYDSNAFGQQLDEILLVTTNTAAPKKVVDFVRTGPTWWTLMARGEQEKNALYAFDENWDFKSVNNLDAPAQPFSLTRWGNKLLLHSDASTDIMRFSASGTAETPFSSEIMNESISANERQARLRSVGSRTGFSVLALCLLMAAGWTYLNHLRALVYNSQRPRGAQPVDDLADQLHWIPPDPNRTQNLRIRGGACGVLSIALCLVAIGTGASATQLAALLCFLAGIALFLLILQRSTFGHIAVQGDRLLLVDHDGMYHIGGGSNIHYRGNFIMIDDVVVYAGSPLWPTFDRDKVREMIVPLASGGVRIDRKTLLVKLTEHRHPLLQSFAGLFLCSILAALILST